MGGHRTFRPSILAHQLEAYGVANVGGAGTFIISKPVSQSRLRADLLRRLPFKAELTICTRQELIAAAAVSPFGGRQPVSRIVRFVSLLAKPPVVVPAIPLRIPEHGRWIVKIISRHERFLFGVYRREMKAIGCLGAIDKLFGAPAITRNWNTFRTILKALKAECDG